MDKEHVKGAVDKAKGAVKESVGNLTGDEKKDSEAATHQAHARQGT